MAGTVFFGESRQCTRPFFFSTEQRIQFAIPLPNRNLAQLTHRHTVDIVTPFAVCDNLRRPWKSCKVGFLARGAWKAENIVMKTRFNLCYVELQSNNSSVFSRFCVVNRVYLMWENGVHKQSLCVIYFHLDAAYLISVETISQANGLCLSGCVNCPKIEGTPSKPWAETTAQKRIQVKKKKKKIE